MKRKVWLITAATFLVFVLLSIAATFLLRARGNDRWILFGGLLFLGLVASALVNLVASARLHESGVANAVPGGSDVIDAAVAAARSRLGGASRLRGAPTILVLGPTGSAKTTIVTESGLAPELIAGEARREGVTVPTAVNIWYAQETLLVEAGGGVLQDPALWVRLLRHLRPGRLAAALGRRAQASRLALVCFPCDELIRAGAAQSVVVAAQQIRDRLLEAARELGVRLPVYVLFTRADRFPSFTEYVRSLSQAEAQEVLGATLAPQPPAAAALYVEREAERLGGELRAVVRSLALRRGDLLAREADQVMRATAYEFPREFRKAADVAVQFLVELTRPSHLGTSPFLRGFYFTGVRPLVVEDATATAPVAAPRAAGSLDATTVFDARTFQAPAPASAAPRGSRRIPDWTFLKRLFIEVVLADRAAMQATAGGARVDGLRRLGLATAAAVCLLAAVGFTTSYVGNQRLERASLAAARGVTALDPGALAAPTPDALLRLDTLRAVTARLRAYDRARAPLHLRWGLYAGNALLPELRRTYFHAFQPALWRDTRAGLLGTLRALPAEPDATTQYSAVYDALKAHLVTTSHAEASSGAFLAPVLMRFWRPAGGPDPVRGELARRQFEFFGAELPFGNPYPDVPDGPTVAQTQAFLQKFGNVQQLYAALVAEASDSVRPLQYSRLVPSAAPAVRNEVVIPGAFTKPGWSFVQRRLRDVNKLFERESWVVGPAAVPPQDRTRLAQQLREQYAAEYVRQWQGYLAGGSVGGLAGPEQAARTLARLGDVQSPLLQMLAIASANTAVDTGVVNQAFQPVHVVVPPTAVDRFVVDANKPYVQALAGLQSALAQVVAATGPAKSLAVAQLTTAADQANGAVMQISQGFTGGESSQVAANEVRRLLQAPVNGVAGLSQGLPAADLNGKGEAFCRQVGRVLAKYPFSGRGADASVDEVTQLFSPTGNAFSTFFEGALQEVMVRQGPRYAAKVGATPQPSAAFVAFFNRAADISRSLFDEDGSGPQVLFVLRPQTSADVTEVTVSIDGQVQTTTRTVAAARTFQWDAARAHDARITAKLKGTDVTVQAPPGTWALFRLLQQADWQSLGGGRYTLRWRVPQGELAADISFAKGAPVFMRDYISGFRCVSEVAR
jgi:type VI secretion system protein ImpL